MPEIEDKDKQNKVQEQINIPEAKVNNKNIISNIEKHAVKGVADEYQKSKLTISVKNGVLEHDCNVVVLGKEIGLTTGDDPSKIRKKIRQQFLNDENWGVNNPAVIQDRQPASLTFTAKNVDTKADNIISQNNSQSEIEFEQVNEAETRKGIEEVKEICNVVISEAPHENKILKVNVKGTNNCPLDQTVEVQIKESDDTKSIAESVYNEFKKNQQLTTVYNIKLSKEDSKITLTQKIAVPIETTVSIVE